jgi:hypothetical protein
VKNLRHESRVCREEPSRNPHLTRPAVPLEVSTSDVSH